MYVLHIILDAEAQWWIHDARRFALDVITQSDAHGRLLANKKNACDLRRLVIHVIIVVVCYSEYTS